MICAICGRGIKKDEDKVWKWVEPTREDYDGTNIQWVASGKDITEDEYGRTIKKPMVKEYYHVGCYYDQDQRSYSDFE